MLTSTPSKAPGFLHWGLKHLSPGKHFTHLAFFGLIEPPLYEP
jgi:hypothetical protein